MNWFETQLNYRIQNDNEEMSDTVTELVQSLDADQRIKYRSRKTIHENAINEMLRYFGKKPLKYPFAVKTFSQKLDHTITTYGILKQAVTLEGEWYKDAFGIMVAYIEKTGTPVTLVPKALKGYKYYDSANKKYVTVTKKNCHIFLKEAQLFYIPFSDSSITFPAFLRFLRRFISLPESLFWLLLVLLELSLVLSVPEITSILFSKVIYFRNDQLIYLIGLVLVLTAVGCYVFRQSRKIILQRLTTRLSTGVQTASMMRMLSLPISFFKRYSAGDLAARIDLISSLCEIIAITLTDVSTFVIYSVINIVFFGQYSILLRAVYSLFTVVLTVIYVISIKKQSDVLTEKYETLSNVNGMTFEIISGIRKIKLTGTEKRFFSRWGKEYAKASKISYSPPESIVFFKTLHVLTTFVVMAILYYSIEYYHLGAPEFFSYLIWTSVYREVINKLLSNSSLAAMGKPVFNLLNPIFQTPAETDGGQNTVTRFSEGIEFSNVYFRYEEDAPFVLKNLTLQIRDGEYVAVVGKTGCGKSTLLRLLIGFEKVDKGAVYINGTDINTLDKKTLRKQIGIVEQDARLFQGDILSNIRLTEPDAEWKQVWQAAEMAGIADDIRAMPMGMHTIISDGGYGVSGGQRQRIAIARALIGKPKLLLLDEATSALDNITQRKVSDALDQLQCTRIVIAHRLSTIKNCDRIIVIDEGQVAEAGSYDELIARHGIFAELVEKQQLE